MDRALTRRFSARLARAITSEVRSLFLPISSSPSLTLAPCAELALLNSAPRAATVRAQAGQGRLRVATLGEKAFTRLLGPVIDLLQRKAQNEYGGSSKPAGQQQE